MIGPTTPAAIINRVLVVEDDRSEADFLRALLERKGMKVDVAKDGGQAHASFTMHQPDVVILKLILPNVTGFEVCEQLNRMNDSVPVLILTEIDMEDARDLAKRVGAGAYMTKPYDPDELLARLQEIANDAWVRTHWGADEGPEKEKVRFECGECGKRLKVNSEHRGRTLNCPRCGQAVMVPKHV